MNADPADFRRSDKKDPRSSAAHSSTLRQICPDISEFPILGRFLIRVGCNSEEFSPLLYQCVLPGFHAVSTSTSAVASSAVASVNSEFLHKIHGECGRT